MPLEYRFRAPVANPKKIKEREAAQQVWFDAHEKSNITIIELNETAFVELPVPIPYVLNFQGTPNPDSWMNPNWLRRSYRLRQWGIPTLRLSRDPKLGKQTKDSQAAPE